MNYSTSAAISFDEMLVGIKDLLEQSPRLREMSLDELYDHVCWHWNHGTISWVEKLEGGFGGYCMIKLIGELKDLDTSYVHDPAGRYIFIEEVVSDGPDTWRELFDQLYEIWGAREFTIWDRRERTEKGCPRVYTWHQYLKILKRLTNGYQPS